MELIVEEVEMTEKISSISSRLTVDRLKGFTDGVLAIVITILVLGIDIPEDHKFSEQGLFAFLSRIGWDVQGFQSGVGFGAWRRVTCKW